MVFKISETQNQKCLIFHVLFKVKGSMIFLMEAEKEFVTYVKCIFIYLQPLHC